MYATGTGTDASSNDCVGGPAFRCAYPGANGGAYCAPDCGRPASTARAADFTLVANVGLHIFLTGNPGNRGHDWALAILGIDFFESKNHLVVAH